MAAPEEGSREVTTTFRAAKVAKGRRRRPSGIEEKENGTGGLLNELSGKKGSRRR